MTRHVDLAVVGAGISGLAAAWEGRCQGAEVVVVDGAPRPGGKLVTSPVGGVDVDESADAFLARVPDATGLCSELGIEAELVSPAAAGAYVHGAGRLRRLPAEQLLGVPTDLDAVAASGIVSPAGIARAREDRSRPDDRPAGDETVGALVRRRLGDEVLDRMVAPLIGGIWAGDCDRLSLGTAAPALAAARERGPSLLDAAAAARSEALAAATAAGDRPVFLAPRGGMGRLVDALGEHLGDRVRTGTTVTAVTPEGSRWRLAPNDVLADAVVVATPAFAAAPLLAPVAPPVADLLAGIEHASVALLTLVVPRDGIDHEMDGTGFLVPRSAGYLLTACSWVTAKWGRPAGDGSSVVLRASAGHAADDRAVTLDEASLVDRLLDDLRATMGLRAAPAATRVTRWPRSFPQPHPGHLDAVDAADAELARQAPRLAATGAWARGVGIPACIRGGRQAAGRVLDAVGGGAVAPDVTARP